jgi:hypothetical protein
MRDLGPIARALARFPPPRPPRDRFRGSRSNFRRLDARPRPERVSQLSSPILEAVVADLCSGGSSSVGEHGPKLRPSGSPWPGCPAPAATSLGSRFKLFSGRMPRSASSHDYPSSEAGDAVLTLFPKRKVRPVSISARRTDAPLWLGR